MPSFTVWRLNIIMRKPHTTILHTRTREKQQRTVTKIRKENSYKERNIWRVCFYGFGSCVYWCAVKQLSFFISDCEKVYKRPNAEICLQSITLLDKNHENLLDKEVKWEQIDCVHVVGVHDWLPFVNIKTHIAAPDTERANQIWHYFVKLFLKMTLNWQLQMESICVYDSWKITFTTTAEICQTEFKNKA